MLKASFQGDFESTDLYVEIISADNEKQSGEYFRAFVQLINKNKEEIGLLAIVDTSFLHRHYDAKYSNDTVETEWFTKNKKYLENLQCSYIYISYSKIVKSHFYKPHYKQVKLDYMGNEEGNFVDEKFRSIIKKMSNEFLEKGTLKQVIKFILDETAGYPALIQYLSEELIKRKHQELDIQHSNQGLVVNPEKLILTLSYPGGFNDAIKHYMSKHSPKFKINFREQSYRFRGSTEFNLFSSSLSSSRRQETSLPVHAASVGNTGYFGTEYHSGYKVSHFALNIAYFVDKYQFSGSLQPVVCMKVIETCEKINKEVAQTNDQEKTYTL